MLAVLGIAGVVGAPMLQQFAKVVGDEIGAMVQPFQSSGSEPPAWLVQVNNSLAKIGVVASSQTDPD